ncbi:MAG: prepilin-type N-terminal cleavage/methylation domain-containing protein [Geminicoccaceae bacterium]
MAGTDRGFTLIETLVAFAILAAGMVTIQQIYAASFRAQGSARNLDETLAVAQSILSGIDATRETVPQQLEGEHGDVSWRASIESFGAPANGLIRISVRAEAPGGQEVRLSSLRYRGRTAADP